MLYIWHTFLDHSFFLFVRSFAIYSLILRCVYDLLYIYIYPHGLHFPCPPQKPCIQKASIHWIRTKKKSTPNFSCTSMSHVEILPANNSHNSKCRKSLVLRNNRKIRELLLGLCLQAIWYVPQEIHPSTHTRALPCEQSHNIYIRIACLIRT